MGDGYQEVQEVISIHAPTRGATHFHRNQCLLYLFQSTLPREERRCIYSHTHIVAYFNPRSHERSDAIHKDDYILIRISIHAPTRGATKMRFFITVNVDISIHAPTRGATISSFPALGKFIISIHAPTRGATTS